MDCIFCDIISKKIPCYKIYEDEDTLAFLDIAKDSYGHTLVIPKKHYKNIFEIDGETLNKVILVTKKIASYYVNTLHFKGVKICNLNNKEAGQSVFHLHFHIFPVGEENKEIDLEEVQKRLKLN